MLTTGSEMDNSVSGGPYYNATLEEAISLIALTPLGVLNSTGLDTN